MFSIESHTLKIRSTQEILKAQGSKTIHLFSSQKQQVKYDPCGNIYSTFSLKRKIDTQNSFKIY